MQVSSDSPAAALAVRLAAAIEPELPAAVALRRCLHAIPELAHEEHETAAAILSALEMPTAERAAGTGIVARLGRSDGNAVAVRAELDAIAVRERTGVPFSARDDAMHACGHDVHMAALVALYRAARTLERELPRPLVALFQPSEENHPSGARMFVEGGVLDGITSVITAHVHPDVPWRHVAAGEGPVNASCDYFRIIVEGRSGHGAYPHTTRDPVVALAEIVVSVQSLVARRTDPMHNAVVTVGTLAAGSAENVIAERAVASGTLRALDPGDRQPLRDALRGCVEHVAAAHDCRGILELVEGEPAVVNDPELVAALAAPLAATGFVSAAPLRSCGADDFGFFGARARLLMLFVGLAGAPGTQQLPLHHPQFLPPDDAVEAVARSQAAAFAAAASV